MTVTVTTEKAISADRSRLMQLFENLFRNAVDNTDGHTTVTVGAVDTGFYQRARRIPRGLTSGMKPTTRDTNH